MFRMKSSNNNPRVRLLAMFSLFILLAFVFTACGGGETAKETPESDKQLYTCGMHPQVIQDEPGNCPICGMKLTPMKAGDVNESPEAEHQHSEAAHQEASEGMDMDKMDKPGESAKAGKKGKKKILYWRAPMDPTYISDKPGKSPMGMDLIPVYEGEEVASGNTVRIDPVTVQDMGVRTALVQRRPFYRVIRTVGHVDYNEEALYNVNTKFHGWLEKLYVNRTGEFVKKGQPLFRIYSPELVSTQKEYLLAFQNYQKLKNSRYAEVNLGANGLLEATRQRLKLWDISDAEIEEIERTGETRKDLTIYSPVTGYVIHKNAVEGSYTMAGQNLFKIADLSTVWVYAHIFEYELPWIKVGQKVVMDLPYMPGQRFEGRVDYVYPYLNAKTRDVKLRLVFKNPTLELKPQMYANIVIESNPGDNVLVIPSEAIIRTGKRNLVFIDLGGGKFRPQDVVIGPEGEDSMVRVIAGLREGQRIVTSAQFLIDSESRLQEAIQKMLEKKKQAAAEKKK